MISHKCKRLLTYLYNGFRAHFFEQGWHTYVKYQDGKCIHLPPKGHGGAHQFIADPFLFHYQGTNWIFYETVDENWKGRIGCFKEMAGRWYPIGVVLECPWHMSYPQVFEEDGHIYMIPEQSASGEGDVSLYEAKDFPHCWEKVTTLIDYPFADATLLRHEGHYYLACYTIPPNETAELWHASSLFGPWERHPQWKNINQSNRLRRCGGSFYSNNGQLFRMAQDCNGAYGKRLFIIPILQLTPYLYQEGSADLFFDKALKPHGYKHTYNEISVNNRKIATFDLQKKTMLPLKIIVKKVFSLGGRLIQVFVNRIIRLPLEF